MDPLLLAIISATATAIGIAIPIVWGSRRDRRCRELQVELAAARAAHAQALREAAQWRCMYYDLMTGGHDLQSRRTQLYHPKPF